MVGVIKNNVNITDIQPYWKSGGLLATPADIPTARMGTLAYVAGEMCGQYSAIPAGGTVYQFHNADCTVTLPVTCQVC